MVYILLVFAVGMGSAQGTAITQVTFKSAQACEEARKVVLQIEYPFREGYEPLRAVCVEVK